jgi:CP family cyanate transporter-like MFS transporter
MPGSRSPVRVALPVLGGLVLVALALRPQVIGVGPLLTPIRAELDISHGVAGLLATIPVLCMGVFAPLGPRLARAAGPRGAIALCVAAIAGFGLLRAIAPGAPAVLLLTFGIGLGMGAVGPILSMIVRLRAARIPAVGTGAYAAGIILGSTIAAAVAVPLAGSAGNWRLAFAIFSLAGLASLAAWLVLVPAETRETRPDVRGLRLPWRSATAWALALVFGIQSLLYYAVVAWLPNVYLERGWSEADAANLVAFMHAVGLGSTIGVPLLADRLGSRRGQLLVAAVGSCIAVGGVIGAADLGYAWAGMFGLSLGAIFPLALTLPVDVSDDATEVGATASLMLLAGYVLSALGPVALGVARDLTGDFGASLWLLLGLGGALVASCWVLSPARLRQGVRHATG